MEEELRSGNTMAAKVIDIDKRLQNLSDQVRGEIERIHEQQNQDQKTREQLGEMYKQVQNHVRAGKEQEAIVVLKTIAERDPENRFGWRTHAQNQIDLLERQLRGEMYPGQKEEIDAKYTRLKAQADSLSSSQDPDTISRAINVWSEIQMLDTRYNEDASRQIAQLQTKLNGLTSARDQVTKKAAAQDRMIKTGLGGAIVLTIIMLVLVWRRGHKRHQELMRKVQEITSIRPMRELGGGETPLLGDSGSARTAAEPDIFTPRTPRATPAFDDSMASAGDPLAAMAPAEPAPAKAEAPAKKSFFGGLKKKKGKEEPQAEPVP
ncbi:hypothetical protein EG831_12510, partial [bacterium]|nr:hypothetical protein [bacterium]